MRVNAVIDDPQIVEKILRHIGAWHDPPAMPPPPGALGPYTYEPCDDVDPAPDYENVLTDSPRAPQFRAQIGLATPPSSNRGP
jgi:hypothetical protein